MKTKIGDKYYFGMGYCKEDIQECTWTNSKTDNSILEYIYKTKEEAEIALNDKIVKLGLTKDKYPLKYCNIKRTVV